MKTIIVATDFSVTARNAADYAAKMAAALDASLLLFHSYQIPVAYLEAPIAFDDTHMRETANFEMEQLKIHLAGITGSKIPIDSEIVLGDFFRELKAVCQKFKPYAVVMGSQGTTAAERMFFGGHAVYAMQHLLYPLITVPIEASYNSIKKIGIASDFDHLTDNFPFEEIRQLKKDFNAELHFIHTGKNNRFNAEVVFESVELKDKLDEPDATFHFITDKDTDDGIISFAEANDIGLLILFPKRHRFIEKVIHRSHTKNLVLHSPVPIMALHL
jgi:nucleotide-binding universal stress UspA family protein